MERTETKKEIRKKIKELLQELKPETISKQSEEIIKKVLNLKEYRQAEKLFCYMGKEDEVQTLPLIEKALADKKEVYLPKVSPASKQIEVFQISDANQDLKKGFYGILEPNKKKPADPDQIDLFILPGLAFDPQGGRLGKGKGMFDQFLASLSEKKKAFVGLAFECQMVSKVPSEKHDIQVFQIITEKRIVKT